MPYMGVTGCVFVYVRMSESVCMCVYVYYVRACVPSRGMPTGNAILVPDTIHYQTSDESLSLETIGSTFYFVLGSTFEGKKQNTPAWVVEIVYVSTLIYLLLNMRNLPLPSKFRMPDEFGTHRKNPSSLWRHPHLGRAWQRVRGVYAA